MTEQQIIDNRHQTTNSGALILIFVGIILLMNTFKVLPWQIWDSLWPWWPLIIIFAGLDIIGEYSLFLQRIMVAIEILILTALLLSLIAPLEIQRYLPLGILKTV